MKLSVLILLDMGIGDEEIALILGKPMIASRLLQNHFVPAIIENEDAMQLLLSLCRNRKQELKRLIKHQPVPASGAAKYNEKRQTGR